MFRKFDAGVTGTRSKGAAHRDCQVRALATARGIPYDTAWKLLYIIQGELRYPSFTLVESLNAGDARLGVIEKIKLPTVKGKPRMTGAEFVKKYPKGRYILRLSHHVSAVKDGVIYDTWDCSKKCVYTAWRIEEHG